MLLRMICRTISSSAVRSVSAPKAATAHFGRPSAVGLRQHAAALVPRTPWQRPPTTLLSLRSFTTSAATKTALVDLLQEELDHENKTYEPPEEVSSGPPGDWQLTETPGDTALTLSREYGKEEISIDLTVTDQPVDPAAEYSDSEAEDEEPDVGVIFNVTVTKGDQSLVFECKSDGSYFDIEQVNLELDDEDVEETTYTGPVYEELDEKLLAEFPKYLAERGVDADLGAYILALVNDKEQREYKTWLKNVKKFISK